MTHRHCVNSCICFLVLLSKLTLIRCYFGACRKYNFVVSVTDLPAPAFCSNCFALYSQSYEQTWRTPSSNISEGDDRPQFAPN